MVGILSAVVGAAHADSVFKTSAGVVFSEIQDADFGQAWKDGNTGTVWSNRFPNPLGYNDAVKACSDLHAELPNASDFAAGTQDKFWEILPAFSPDPSVNSLLSSDTYANGPFEKVIIYWLSDHTTDSLPLNSVMKYYYSCVHRSP